MLDRLVAADRAAEGVPVLGIVIRHLEADRGAAELFEGEQHGHPVQQLGVQRVAVALAAEAFGRRRVKMDLSMAAGRIDRLQRLARDALGRQVDQHQRHTLAFLGQHDRMGRDVAVGDGDLHAGQRLAVECGAQGSGVRIARAFGSGIGADHVAGGDLRQDGGFLLLAAAQLHRFGQVIGGRGERDGRNRAAHLFGQHAHLQHAEAQPAMLFRNGGAEPAHFDDLFPEVGMVGELVVVQHLADFRCRAFGRQELPGFTGEVFLVFGEIKIHGALAPIALLGRYLLSLMARE